jgi:hypothetical protein
MSIQSPVGTLDIKNATLRVGKLEVSNIQGVDTALNVTRANSVLIYDDQVSTTTFNGTTSSGSVRDTGNGYLDLAGGYVYWGQKLPNSWVMDFEMDIRSGTNAGPLYANVFSTTNTGGDGYSFTFNDSNDKISLYYDSTLLTETTVSGLFTASEDWQKVVINYERGLIAISLDGSRKFYYKDIERETPYVNGEYVSFSSASTDGRKIRDLRIVNGEKWVYSGESNVVYTQGSVGIGVTDPTAALDVSGTVKATTFDGDGSAITNISSANVGDFASNVTRIENLETSNGHIWSNLASNVTTLRSEIDSNLATARTDLQSNVTILRDEIDSNLATARTDLQSNVTILRDEIDSNLASNVTILRGEIDSNLATARSDLQSNVTILRDTAITFTGTKTFQDDVVLESNLRVQGDLLVANTVNMTVSDPILELGSNNLNTGDVGIVMTRHGASNSNVAIFFDETADTLKLGYTLNGAGDSTLEFDSNALAVSVQGAFTASTVSGNGSGLTTLNASNLASGTVPSARLSLAASDIPNLDASKITSGTLTRPISTTTGTFSGLVTMTGQKDDADGYNRASYWDYDDKVALMLKPAADDGAVAILFPSQGNVTSDFAYIVYDEDYGEAGVTAGENGALILGCENDGTGSSDHVRVKSRLVVEADMSTTDPTNAFQVKSSNTESDLFTVTRAGDVGIGATSPGYKLDVHGTSNVGALTATSVSGDGSGLTSLNASNLGSGTVPSARLSLAASDIPSLDASKITTGTLGTARIPDLDASKITSGTLGTARIPSLDASKITSGTLGRPISTTTGTFSGLLTASGGVRSYKDGVVADFKPATDGEYTLMKFQSKVNEGSDMGFILVQDESANSPGTSSEDLRMTIGVHNDFRQSASHSDELWFQGGGRLVYNVGSWDSELNTIIGTPGVGTTGGHEWRVNNSTKMVINHSGNVGIGVTDPDTKLEVRGSIKASYSDTNHGMIIENGGTVRRDYGGYGAGFHFTNSAIWSTNHLGSYSTGGIDFGSSTYRWNNVYTEALNASGDVKTGNNLYVGTNTNDETAKTIYFGGTYGDNAYDHCVIERRVWSTGTEKQELLLFSGNDGESGSGPDRIRLKGAQILFDTLNNSTDRTTENTKMIIRADGDVGIGTTSPSYKLHVSGDIYATGNVTAYSDVRKKKNLEIIEKPIEKVNKLNGYTYEMDDKRYTGLVAQEVIKVLPEAVVGSEEKGYGLAYGNMAGLFVEAMKEMNEQLQTEKARNDALEARIAALENS